MTTVFHIATAADWADARRRGTYTTSRRGVTLEQEGFIHAARREQVPDVWRRYYADVGEPLVLLTIDTDRLGCPWREDAVGDTTYPHIYGPIETTAVVRVQPLDTRGGTGSFTSLFFREMAVRIALFVLAMLLAFIGASLGRRTATGWGESVGAVSGLVAGVALMVVVLRRRA